MKRKRVGNASTRYCFEPEKLDADVQNKLSVRKQFEDDLRAVLYKEYRYSEGNGSMSHNAKREALVKVAKEFIDLTGER